MFTSPYFVIKAVQNKNVRLRTLLILGQSIGLFYGFCGIFKEMIANMIEIRKSEDNTYQFTLKTSDGITLLNSIDFDSEEEVQQTVQNLNPILERQSVFERRTDHEGKFLFKLKDLNGRVIGNSQRYSSEAGMENGIKNLKRRIANISKES